MKNLIKLTTIALVLTATSASANTQSWVGNSGSVGSVGCVFSNRTGNNIGAMTRSSVTGEDHIWKTTRRGAITVIARGQSTVTLTSDNKLFTAEGVEVEGIVATFNYNGLSGDQASIIQRRGASTPAVNDQSLVVSNLGRVQGASRINFFTGGTVTMTANGSLNGQSTLSGLSSDTVYKVIHTVTCVQ